MPPSKTDALRQLSAEVAACEPHDIEPRWNQLCYALHGVAVQGRWNYVALLCLARLVERGWLRPTDPLYIESLVFNHRINDALYLKLYHEQELDGATNRPLRRLRLPARRWNLAGTDRWVSGDDIRRELTDIMEEAATVDAARREAWIARALVQRFGALNNRLKDGALMQMMRHAGALNGMQWRRLTKDTMQEVVHVRLHAASSMLTTTIRVGGPPQRVMHLLPSVMLPHLSAFDRERIDEHFAMRALGRRVFDTLVTIRDRELPASDSLAALQSFYELLLAPLFAKPGVAARIAALGERPTLAITTHGALAQLPFAALHDGDRYLAERFNVVQAPPLFPAEDFATGDIDWDTMLGGEAISPTVTVRGLFDTAGLEEARVEASNLRRHFGDRATVFDGTWDADAVRRLTRERGLAFLSAHIDPSGEGAEGTALKTPDKRLLAFGPMLTEPMAADLLVLAGCISSGQSDWLADGENSLVSMYRRAGVAAVISTLWPVDDRATRLYTDALMAALAAGKSRAQAHGDAQRHVLGATLSIGDAYRPQERLIHQPAVAADAVPVASQMTFDHPYFWSAFTLAGAWR